MSGAALIGVVMLVTGQALAIWGTRFLPAGVRLVLAALPGPVRMGVFHQPLTVRQVAGVAIGFVGLALMSWTSATGSHFRPMGAVLALAASAVWAAGSLLASRSALPCDPVIGLTIHLAAAEVVLAATVTMSEIAATSHRAQVPLSAWAALVSGTLANTFNYAAHVVALCLCALLLHEPLTLVKLVSGGIAWWASR